MITNPVFATIVFPAYNETERIETALRKTAEFIKRSRGNWEVIVIENGSTDNTYEKTMDIALEIVHEGIPNMAVRLLRSSPGKGSALRLGMEQSRGEHILLTDVDLSTPLREVWRLLGERRKGYDVVIGSRNMPTSLVIGRSADRKITGRVFNGLTSILTPGIRDTQCGFKMLSRNVVKKITPLMIIDGFAFDVELLFLARQLGFSISEVGVHWEHDPRSTVRVVPDSLKMARDVIRIAINYVSGSYRA